MTHKVQTTDGVLADNGRGTGLSEQDAEASAAARNARAEKLGIKTRYEAVPR